MKIVANVLEEWIARVPNSNHPIPIGDQNVKVQTTKRYGVMEWCTSETGGGNTA